MRRRIKDKFSSRNSKKNTKSGKGDKSSKPYTKKQNPDLGPLEEKKGPADGPGKTPDSSGKDDASGGPSTTMNNGSAAAPEGTKPADGAEQGPAAPGGKGGEGSGSTAETTNNPAPEETLDDDLDSEEHIDDILSIFQPGYKGKTDEELYGGYATEDSEIDSDEESVPDIAPILFESEAQWNAKKGTDPEGWDETVKAHFASLPNAEFTSVVKELRVDLANNTEQLKYIANTTEELRDEFSNLTTLINSTTIIDPSKDRISGERTGDIDESNEDSWMKRTLGSPPEATSTPAVRSSRVKPIPINFDGKEKPAAPGSVVGPSPLHKASTPGSSSSSSEASPWTSPTKPPKGKEIQKGNETTGSFSTPAAVMAPLNETSERLHAITNKISKHMAQGQGEVQVKKLGDDIAKLQATVDKMGNSVAHALGRRSTSEYDIYGYHPLVFVPGFIFLVAAIILGLVIMGVVLVVVCDRIWSWMK